MNFEKLQTAIVGAIQQVFKGAQQLETTPVVSNDKTRAIAARILFDQVYEALSEINMAARKVDEYGNVYMDWEMYLNCLDVFYDNGSLFAVVTQAGKLYRIPIDVTNDVATLGEMVEIPLNATGAARSTIRFFQQDGKWKWSAIACSSILNRVNEIDSRRLFDSFIVHAEKTNEYPILSFYHADDVIRWGVATWLYRNEDLYCAAGDVYETPDAQRAAQEFADSKEEWGTSIGYKPTQEPEWLELERGIAVPVFWEGINTEISIVLEREAAAYLTAFGTQEVIRMTKNDLAYQRLVERFGEEYANQYLDDVNGAQRAIDAANPIRRDAATVNTATSEPVATAATETVVAPTADATTQERDAAAQTIEIPEEMYDALAASFVATPTIQQLIESVNALNSNFAQLPPRITQLETSVNEARTVYETRLAALEQDDETRHAEWLADLPTPKRTVLTLRPRETRAVELDGDGNPKAPDSTVIANSTVEKLNAKRAQQHA